ncbi:hypothetical protein GCM10023259_006150 [Thermocatellispora tengchongensis]
MLTQSDLRARFDERIGRAVRLLPPGGGDPGFGAVAVVRDAAPETFIRSAVAFARRAAAGTAGPLWYGNFTRTVFLAGDPRNLAVRHPPDVVAPDGAIAWYGPGRLAGHATLRRMLRPFAGTTPVTGAGALRVPLGGGGTRTAYVHVATAGLTLRDYLVHVNHLLAEAVLDGLLADVAALVVRHAPRLPAPPGRHDAVRVAPDPSAPGLLRAHACLTVAS